MKRVAYVILFGISAGIISVLTALNLFCTAYVAYDNSERVRIAKEFPGGWLLLGIALTIFLYGVVKLCEKLAQKSSFQEQWLYFFCCGIYLLIGGGLIYWAGGTLREEPLRVYETARQFSQGDFQALAEGGYIFHKLHQLGLVTYERILGLISYDVNFFFVVNLLLINGINYLSYRLSDILFHHNRKVNILTICLSYLFLPQMLFVLFAYGLVPGLFFMMLGFYAIERYFACDKKGWLVLSIVSVSAAVLLKSNYLIGAITIALLCMLRCLKTRKRCYLLAMVAAVVLPCMMLKMLPLCYRMESGMEINEGEPMLSYVAMGINPMNEGIGPGWYDGSNYMWYQDAGYDNALATEKAKQCIRNCFGLYRENPVGAVKFFGRKTISQWCEPMYQSVWSGPLEAMGQSVQTPLLQSLYSGGSVERCISVGMKAFLQLIYITALAFLLKCRKQEWRTEYAYIFFVGGFLFHLFWEAKSQYIYPYVFVLLPSCAWILNHFFEYLDRKVSGKNRQGE